MPPLYYPPFSGIRIGEPDANSEYFSALRNKKNPVFLDCFFTIPSFPLAGFMSGEKFIIYGQKGTGKTSILRFMENAAREKGAASEFLIFKKTLLEEIDLSDFAKLPLSVDEDAIKSFKHFHHTVKRLLILVLLNKIFKHGSDEEIDGIDDEGSKTLLRKISNSTVGDAIRLGMDSISSIFQSINLDVKKLTNERLLVEGGRLLKRNNDDLLSFLIRRLKKNQSPIRLFLDEIHFAYRSEESLQQDAILVRDTILAVQSLNERFSEEGIDSIIYVAVRSEYLEHPIISTADINHAVESVGFELTWSSFPQRKDHPLFQLVFLRFKEAIGSGFNFSDFLNVYMGNIDPIVFLERTWSKPRDFVRYFKCAQKLYPNKSLLSVSESNAVWRNYSQEAWREIRSSASPFLPPKALTLLDDILARIAPSVFDGSQKYDMTSFGELFRPVYESAKGEQKNFYTFEHFLRLLYILGIFLTRRNDANNQMIYHSYHRGNRNYHSNGEVMIHPTVLKAFG